MSASTATDTPSAVPARWKDQRRATAMAIERTPNASRSDSSERVIASSIGNTLLASNSLPTSQMPQIPLMPFLVLFAERRLPFSEHQRRPKQRRPVVRTVLVLIPNHLQE